MKIDLPALSLALSRASSGIRRTEDPTSGAVLLGASGGLLQASMTDGHRLSIAICPCEGDLKVAAEADRLVKLLQACSAPTADLSHSPNGDLLFKAAGTKAKLRGYDIALLPRQDYPDTPNKVDLSAEMSDRIRWSEKLTRDKVEPGTPLIERVVLIELTGQQVRVFSRLSGTLVCWWQGECSDTPKQAAINRSIAAAIPSGPAVLVWSDTKVGFESDGQSSYESAIELDSTGPWWKLAEKCPAEGPSFDPKAIAGAIAGAVSVHPADTWGSRSVVLEAKGEVLSVISQSHAGEYLAEVPLSAPMEFKGRFNAELLSRAALSLKSPSLGITGLTLWMWEGQSKLALQGMVL